MWVLLHALRRLLARRFHTTNPWDEHDAEEWKQAQRLLLVQGKQSGDQVINIVRDRVRRGQCVEFPDAVKKEVQRTVDTWGFLDRPSCTMTNTEKLYMKAALMKFMHRPASGLSQATYAAATGSASVLQSLVERDNVPYNGVHFLDEPALHFAVVLGNLDAAKFLVTLPMTDVNSYHEQGGASCLDLLTAVLREKSNVARLQQDDVLWEVWRVLMDAGRGHFLKSGPCEALTLLVRRGPMSLLRHVAVSESDDFAKAAPDMLAELVRHHDRFSRAEWQQRHDLVMANLPSTHPLFAR